MKEASRCLGTRKNSQLTALNILHSNDLQNRTQKIKVFQIAQNMGNVLKLNTKQLLCYDGNSCLINQKFRKDACLALIIQVL